MQKWSHQGYVNGSNLLLPIHTQTLSFNLEIVPFRWLWGRTHPRAPRRSWGGIRVTTRDLIQHILDQQLQYIVLYIRVVGSWICIIHVQQVAVASPYKELNEINLDCTMIVVYEHDLIRLCHRHLLNYAALNLNRSQHLWENSPCGGGAAAAAPTLRPASTPTSRRRPGHSPQSSFHREATDIYTSNMIHNVMGMVSLVE